MSEDIPIYVPCMSPEYFDCIESAADAVWDDGQDPTTVEAYKCRVGKAHTPHIYDIVSESWYMEFDDPEVYDCEIPGPLAEELEVLYNKLVEAAPVVWTPDLSKRVTLPAIDCPACGCPSDAVWPSTSPDCHFCDRPNKYDAADEDTAP